MNGFGLDGLLWLQAHRTGTWEAVALQVSGVGEGVWISTILALIFWLWGSRAAYRTGFALVGGWVGTVWVKGWVCMPRPWVRWLAIEPVEAALGGAWGYSFPSGHVASAVLWAGGVAGSMRRWWGWVLAGCWMGLMGWSRMTLGVHTGWDVWGGILLGLAFVFGMGWLYEVVEGHARWRWVVLGGAVVVGVLASWDAVVREMPVDALPEYREDVVLAGVLLAAFFTAWFVERTWIGFRPKALGRYRVPAAGVGLVLLHLMHGHLALVLPWVMPVGWVAYAVRVLEPLFVFVVWPLVVRPLEGE